MAKFQPETKPYPYQWAALKKLLHKGSGALFLEMGLGKSWIAINFAGAMCVRKQRNLRVLVVCPLSVMGTWEKQIEQHGPKYLPPSFTVINYDQIRILRVLEDILDYPPDIIIADESHRIKNPQAKQSKAMYRLSLVVPHRVMLTGTPITKSPLDLYSQFRFIDTAIFGTNWGAFKSRYAVYGGYFNKELKRLKNMKEMKRKIAPYTYRATKADLDLPPILPDKVLSLKLAPTGRTVYDQLANEAVAYCGEKRVVADNVLTRALRCQQVAGGWVKNDKGKWMRTGTEKRDVFRDMLVDHMAGDITKIVVFCRFIPELRDILYACKKTGYTTLPFYGGVRREYRDRLIERFHETKKPTVFAAQIQTGSLGIDLTPAHHAVFYSLTHGYGEYRQARDRVHRHGQSEPVRYSFILAEDTIDYGIMLALRKKRKLEDLILKYPALYRGKLS